MSSNVLEQNDDELVDLSSIPVLPLRDCVVFPNIVIPLFVGRVKSIKALEVAMLQGKAIFLVAQRNLKENPKIKDLYQYGTIANLLQLLKLPDGSVKLLVEGAERARVLEYVETEDYLSASVELIKTKELHESRVSIKFNASTRLLLSQFEQYIKLNKKIPPEVLSALLSIEEPSRLIDSIAAHLNLNVTDKQEILETFDVRVRVEKIMSILEREIELLQVERRLHGRVKKQMERSQREYYLNEQLKAIQKELGQNNDESEFDQLENAINKANMPEDAQDKARSELKKLKNMSSMSAEATVTRSYLDWLISVPWKKLSKIQNNLKIAQEVLEKDHYGLEKVKERILEYLAVQKRVKKPKGPILCLVGPPGVGKTSLGQSIAKATSREFIRIALGGMRDEAEIRGHRRTYIGSMPGKIIQKICKSGVKNPLIMLDEIDKMSMDFRGDPTSALLEVLDPEQNNSFSDNYLEVSYDLSDVMFIATANSLDLPEPLLDRMEVINLSGYTEDEKLHIAREYLLPKQFKLAGLKKREANISSAIILDIIRYYTREAGVRGLERNIAKICRKVVKAATLENDAKLEITCENLPDYLGIRKFKYGLIEQENYVGEVTGLAWTRVGGEILTVEASMMPGKGVLQNTGKLGEVMQESIKASMTVARNLASKYAINAGFYEKNDFHIHIPEGAIPKDGPSAGIAICTALISVITNIPVRHDIAMTGEITLRGQVLAIGGLKEKLLAAHRAGVKLVLIPEDNKKDLTEIPEKILKNLTVQPVKNIEEVLDLALANGNFKKQVVKRAVSASRKNTSTTGVRKKSKNKD